MIMQYLEFVRRTLPIAGWMLMAAGLFMILTIFIPGLIEHNDLTVAERWAVGGFMLVTGFFFTRMRIRS